MLRIPPDIAARAAASYSVAAECFISDYSMGSHGYAQVGGMVDGKRSMTTCHRAAYVHYSGEQIPTGMTVDHICRNRRCVRKDHLRLMTNHDNARMNVPANGHYSIDWSCPKNHGAEYRHTKPNGQNICTACRADAQRKYRAKRAGA